MAMIVMTNIYGLSIPTDTVIKTPQLLKFEAYQNGEKRHESTITIGQSEEGEIQLTEILTHTSASDIIEYNECVLGPRYELYSVNQVSKNKRDDAFFKWTIYVKKQEAQISYTELKTLKESKESKKFPKNTYPIQGLLFLLQYMDLGEESYRFQLLVPPATTYSMEGYVIGDEEVDWNGARIKTTIVEFRYAGLFGIFLPKAKFWVSKDRPHVPIKYKDMNYTYYLVK